MRILVIGSGGREHALVRALDEKSHQGPTRGQTILNQLRQRGVVILEIDAGAKPSTEQPARLVAGIAEPVQALNNASYANAELAREFYVDELKKRLTFAD